MRYRNGNAMHGILAKSQAKHLVNYITDENIYAKWEFFSIVQFDMIVDYSVDKFSREFSRNSLRDVGKVVEETRCK